MPHQILAACCGTVQRSAFDYNVTDACRLQSVACKASFKPKQPETLAMLGQPSAGPSGHEPENDV